MSRQLDEALCPPHAESWGRAGAAGLPAVLLAVVLSISVLKDALPAGHWFRAVLAPARMNEILFDYAVLPRMAAALLCGATLGVAGFVFQRVLRNPLSTPDTTGVTGGAQLALALAALLSPNLANNVLVALIGSLLVLAGVLASSWRSRMAPTTPLLAGLSFTLLTNAVTTLLILLKARSLYGLLVWSGGSLAVQSWSPVAMLALWSAVLVVPLSAGARHLALFEADDTMIRALGGSPARSRTAMLVIAVGLTAVVSAEFGAIGFVSLAAPLIVRALQLRGYGASLAWSAGWGALILVSTDDVAVLLSHRIGIDLPTGAAVSVLGAPLLVAIAANRHTPEMEAAVDTGGRRARRPRMILAGLLMLLLAACAAGLLLGRNGGGWKLAWPASSLQDLLPWRGPRTLASGAAGALLALSGFLLQRISGNPMAAPEMLGLSAGAGFTLLLATLVGATPAIQDVSAVIGAVTAALMLVGWAARRAVEPARLLVAGLACTMAVGSLVSVFAATGDPRALPIMAWMTGSTYRVEFGPAAALAGIAVASLPLTLLAVRWLELQSIESTARQALGVSDAQVRLLLLVFAAIAAGAGTLIVGPLSFVGVLAPQLALRCGLERAGPQALGTLLTGALLMVGADVIGRTIAFPWQIPSGIVAALIGTPCALGLFSRGAHTRGATA